MESRPDFYEIIGAEMAVKIEPLDSKLFQIANEYWISFQYDDFMYDKKSKFHLINHHSFPSFT